MTISAEEYEALSRVISQNLAARELATNETPQLDLQATEDEIGEVTVGPPTSVEKSLAKKTKRQGYTDTQAVLKMLDLNSQGKPQSNLKNAIRLLRYHPAWNAPEVLYYDEFSLEICTRNSPPWEKVGNKWQDVDDIRVADWMQSLGVIVTPNTARDAVEAVARETIVHPVRDYLTGLHWDRRPRVDSWLATYLGAEDSPLNRAVGKNWLVSAAARIFQPGVQVDHCLSLEGPQGAGKSTVLRTLAGDKWFSDHLSDLANKDSRMELLGKWIVELSELGPVRRSDNERVKQFLTARFDFYRPPYGRRACQVPRQCVFAASFNDSTPFTDATGNRRFWPVSCGRIKLSQLQKDRDQLWAEAYALYRAGSIWWLDSAELNRAIAQEQSDRMQPDAWDTPVLEWATDPQAATVLDTPLLSQPGQVTVAEILTHALKKSVERWDRSDEMRVSHILTKFGWKRKRVKLNGWRNQGTWFYIAPTGEI